MYYLMKKFRIPIGHRLSKHKGLCRNIHGHNLMIAVHLYSPMLNEQDMVMDFSELKKIVTSILNEFDHATLFSSKDKKNITFFKSQGYKTKIIDDIFYDSIALDVKDKGLDPTAEVIAKYLFDKIGNMLPEGVILKKVLVWENKDSMAGYSE